MYTNSASMITKLNHMNEYLSAPLKMNLHADWDFLSDLHTALKWFPTRPTFHHVRSHQDNDPSQTALTLKEQLNVDANNLTTTAFRLLEPKPHVTFDSDSHIQVEFQGCTITQNLKPTLREKLLLPAFHRYCERWMGWSSTTFDVINWDLFRLAYRKQAKKICNGSKSFASGISLRDASYIESTTERLSNAAHAEPMLKMTTTFSNVKRDLTF